MLGLRLVRLIEKHSAEIAESLMARILESERTKAYRTLPTDELRASLVSLYAHLGEWLLTKTEADVERRFRAVGAQRSAEGIPASQLAWALHLSKAQIWGYVYKESGAEKALELYGELEFLETLDRFFDHAVFHALNGYEERARSQKAA
jgi:hypothetical protein